MKNFVILTFIFIEVVFANSYFNPVAVDSRIKTFIYSPNEIYNLKFRIGYNSIIEFSKDEAIETISLGDPYPWKLTPLGTRLFIKPIETGSQTNMTVITNKRVYLFDIESEIAANVDRNQIVHVARFFYQSNSNVDQFQVDQKKRTVTGLQKIVQEKRTNDENNINLNYTFSGSKNTTTPIEMFDDQKRTYIKFSSELNTNKLEIFSIQKNKKRIKMNFKRTGDFIILEGVYRSLLFESTNFSTFVFNDKAY
jgi:type IV secretion system protein VirB9